MAGSIADVAGTAEQRRIRVMARRLHVTPRDHLFMLAWSVFACLLESTCQLLVTNAHSCLCCTQAALKADLQACGVLPGLHFSATTQPAYTSTSCILPAMLAVLPHSFPVQPSAAAVALLYESNQQDVILQ
jgi:hypothetical protein